MKSNQVLAALLFFYATTLPAQQTNIKKSRLLSFNISLSDYNLPGHLNDSAFSKEYSNEDWLKPGNKSLGIGVSYWKGFTPHIDLSATLTGTFSNFPANFVKDDSIGRAKFSPQLDVLLHARAFKEKTAVNPFLTAGLGAGYFPDQFAVYAPVGAGLQFYFNQGAYLLLQAQWRKKLTAGIQQDYLFFSLGFAQDVAIKKKKESPVVQPVLPAIPADKDGDGFADKDDLCPDVKGTLNGCPDTDADGIADKDDLCPLVKGTLHGCPDTDGDGIADKDDLCPDVKGTLHGCPDTDGDGIADKDDQCKDVAGVARYKGCPVPDTDHDGINDETDKCPNVAGLAVNGGCPEIKQEVKKKVEMAAKNIFFAFAKDVILEKSFKPLNEIAGLLKDNPEIKLTIEAHADNIGTAERNIYWSERRAKAVADYFISKGIAAERITWKGYGDTRPIADNSTEKGRAMNRRVEMTVHY